MGLIEIKIVNINEIKAAFKKAPAEMTKSLSVAVRRVIFIVEARSQRNAPIKTGRLRGSLYRDFGPLRGEIGYKASYAGYVHDGTSPYTIYPNGKKALYWKGASHPVKRVAHPGIRANPFLQRAVDDSGTEINKIFEVAVQSVLDGIAKETG